MPRPAPRPAGREARHDVIIAATAGPGSLPWWPVDPAPPATTAWVGLSDPATDPTNSSGGWQRYPVTPRPQLLRDFLEGHCAATIAPLYFDTGTEPRFEALWRQAYRAVNAMIAEAAARRAAPGATVWVHDHHLQLVPGFLRARRPDLRIGFFLHSPFPAPERFLAQPSRDLILASLRAADLIGVQTRRAAANFADVCATRPPVNPAAADHPGAAVGVFPTSVETAAIEARVAEPALAGRAATLRTRLGNPRVVVLSIGADHTGGADGMLAAYARLLADGDLDPRDTVLVHVAVCGDDPTHLRCDRGRIDRQIAQINGLHGQVGHTPIHYVHGLHDRDDILALYKAADIMLALPLRDGMHLAAKEYLAARTDDTGRLILSEFSGAATDLPEADVVNPHDQDAVAHAIRRAVGDCRRPTDAVAAMRRRLRRRDAHAWLDDVTTALARSAARPAGSAPAGTRP